MYEATIVPSDWAQNFKEIDEWWVPYDGMKTILVDNHGVSANRIHVVEEGLDTRRTFNPDLFDYASSRARIYPKDAQGGFIFVSIFKWETRKAYEELIRAFVTAFPGNESVTLFLRTTPPQSLQDIVSRLVGKRDERIRVLERQEDHRYMQMLAGADGFVAATHGEGWGRPIMEAMAMGLPTIATNWSGPTQFMTQDTGYLLPVKGLVAATGLPGADSRAQWADIDVGLLAGLMKRIVEHPNEAQAVGARARQRIVQHYDQDAIAEQVLDRLQQACERQQRGILPRHLDTPHVHPRRGSTPAPTTPPRRGRHKRRRRTTRRPSGPPPRS
ncbi:uncharacterized protein MONBRDRAFT_20619 [Monosiga brevicollis MX1]|uniref:Glycosyl transferase family 1 domain-containing protein n=1 Tax=Monosiga brevicollis TaxID=81824 RepID=A9UWN0_MONBE|nr:uncharacterized protein MONBRDRAFT_20619 [Monosiga brevicollis MX1]EDQ90242.1 predicted protein [Monosiga brevicollis MX1]|eukprot:XP_001745009.1 hypothetical protein [Monosiga brevicollis MX1]